TGVQRQVEVPHLGLRRGRQQQPADVVRDQQVVGELETQLIAHGSTPPRPSSAPPPVAGLHPGGRRRATLAHRLPCAPAPRPSPRTRPPCPPVAATGRQPPATAPPGRSRQAARWPPPRSGPPACALPGSAMK